MKIGILTQPLQRNYGGLLQAYALQKILKKEGHDTWIIDREFFDIYGIKKIIKYLFKLSLYMISTCREKPLFITQKQESIISEQIFKFIDIYINPKTNKIYTNKKLRSITRKKFNAYIVGSDQVWRPSYSPCIFNYFLDFLGNDNSSKRIAYAASFGVDIWEYNAKENHICSKLAKKFNAISVREDSAVSLCKEYLDVNAIQVLDPTMLLSREEYIDLVKEAKEEKSEGSLMTYILDETSMKNEIIHSIAKEFNLIPFSVMPELPLNYANMNQIEKCIYPSVTKWLRGFMDAKFVVVDSFHGCVFSIIFNKPFLVVGNSQRGMTRFTSLLKLFNLEDRLVNSIKDVTTEKINKKIDWAKVDQIKQEQIDQSIIFLQTHLK